MTRRQLLEVVLATVLILALGGCRGGARRDVVTRPDVPAVALRPIWPMLGHDAAHTAALTLRQSQPESSVVPQTRSMPGEARSSARTERSTSPTRGASTP